MLHTQPSSEATAAGLGSTASAQRQRIAPPSCPSLDACCRECRDGAGPSQAGARFVGHRCLLPVSSARWVWTRMVTGRNIVQAIAVRNSSLAVVAIKLRRFVTFLRLQEQKGPTAPEPYLKLKNKWKKVRKASASPPSSRSVPLEPPPT